MYLVKLSVTSRRKTFWTCCWKSTEHQKPCKELDSDPDTQNTQLVAPKKLCLPSWCHPSVTMSPELWFHLPPTQNVLLHWLGGLQAHELCCCKLMFPRDNEHIPGNQSLGACLLPLVPQLSLGSFGELFHFISTESSGLRWSCKYRGSALKSIKSSCRQTSEAIY